MRQNYNFWTIPLRKLIKHTYTRQSEQINISVTETLSRDPGPCQQQSSSNKTPEQTHACIYSFMSLKTAR